MVAPPVGLAERKVRAPTGSASRETRDFRDAPMALRGTDQSHRDESPGTGRYREGETRQSLRGARPNIRISGAATHRSQGRPTDAEGRPQESRCKSGPREMTISPQGEQNSAYTPAPRVTERKKYLQRQRGKKQRGRERSKSTSEDSIQRIMLVLCLLPLCFSASA